MRWLYVEEKGGYCFMLKLSDLDLSKCLYDPNKSTLLKDVEHIPEFNIELSYRMSRKAVLTYIILLYDQASSLRKEIRSLPSRKGMAAQLAGFKLDKNGRFEPPVERFLEGKNQDINAMIVKYLLLQNSPKYVQLIAYESLYFYEIAKIQNGAYGKTIDVIKSVDSLASSIDRLTEEVVGGKGESESILAAIYKEVTKDLNVSPEAISNYISESGDVPEDWSPYNTIREKDGKIEEVYKVDKLRYVGAE